MRGGDAAIRPKLEAQLLRKDPGADYTMEAIVARAIAMRAMAVRALGFGAAQGLSELADPAAAAALEAVATDPLQNEEVRLEACAAWVWCTPEEGLATLAGGISKRFVHSDPAEVLRARCLLTGLSRRAAPESAKPATRLLLTSDPSLLVPSAALIATAGLGEEETTVVRGLDDEVRRPFVAAALFLGGSEDGARRAAEIARGDDRLRDSLTEILRAIDAVTHAHLRERTLFRWARNFRAAGEPPWAAEPLRWFFQVVQFDVGPHSLSRVVLRRRLVEHAVFGEPQARQDARAVLSLMDEHGARYYLDRVGPGSR